MTNETTDGTDKLSAHPPISYWEHRCALLEIAHEELMLLISKHIPEARDELNNHTNIWNTCVEGINKEFEEAPTSLPPLTLVTPSKEET